MHYRQYASTVQWMKDRIIESGAEPLVRPLWSKLTGHDLCATDLELGQVIAQVIRPDSLCIDIGAHKGLILDMCIRYAPKGTLYAFEPIPYLAKLLRRKYRWNSRVTVHEMALSDKAGTASFFVNNSAMGYSSLVSPNSNVTETEVQECVVKVSRLDDVLPQARPTFIKIDVEGAELGVLRGAREMLTRSRPTIAFEHALGGADRFSTTPENIFDFFSEIGFKVSTMPGYLNKQPPFSRSEFSTQFYRQINSNFLAYPA